MNRSRRKVISSKLRKTKILSRSAALIRYVPQTDVLTSGRLSQMLHRYGMVYIKPVTGSLGIGVMRIDNIGGSYRYQSGLRTYTFDTFRQMYASIRRRIDAKRYLVQRGIDMLRHKERPFDFRVMVQRNPSGSWECTGTAARLAHPNKVVTNGSQGGTIYPAGALLEEAAGKQIAGLLTEEMKKIAVFAAYQFSRFYPAMNELGLDIAVDGCLRPWILEVNTRPDPCPFTKLPDPAVIGKIKKYARAYGRVYNLACMKARKAPSLPSD
ncbi:YheC/YheD family protein [Paenibacillus alkalitolerans]|uniref:YheC/YheD family protein n=1 Tax=Paenibacillus alkalitolerans TaxID=2799335 RepID=UPI0018F443C9|nr:YheC/YheD family protein [Paenibacillus alkalitolerans]